MIGIFFMNTHIKRRSPAIVQRMPIQEQNGLSHRRRNQTERRRRCLKLFQMPENIEAKIYGRVCQ